MVRSYGDQSASMHVHFSILIDEWTGPLFLNFTKKKVIKCFWEAHQINLSFCRMNRIVHGKLSHNISSGFPERSPGPTYSLGWRKALTDRLSSHWQRDPDFWLSPLGFSRKHFKVTFWWTAEHLHLLCFFFLLKGLSRNSTDDATSEGYYKSVNVGPLVVWSLLLSFIALTIILSNTLVIFSFIKYAKLRTRTNCLIISLAVADLLVGLVSVPGWLILIHKEENQRSTWYSVLMEIWYVFEILSGVGSIFHLMALSWDRLCAIVWPLKHRSYTKTKYLVIIFVAWSVATLVSGLSVTGNRNSPQAYNMTVICLCFFLPLVLIFLAQGITLVTIKRNIAKFHHSSSLKRDVRATKTILIMIGLFLIAWLPFFSLGLVRFIQDDHSALPANAIFAVKMLQYSNSLFNPILYGQKFPEFRKAYIMILCSAKSDGDSARFAISSSVNTNNFGTSSSTIRALCPPPQRSHRLLRALIRQHDEKIDKPQEEEELTFMDSGLWHFLKGFIG